MRPVAAAVVLASVSSWLQHQHGPLLYLAVGGLVFFEVGIFIGFFIPGEIASVVGGVLAGEHHANVVLMGAVVAAAAVVGNLCGYRVGQLIGPWLLDRGPLRGSVHVRRAERLIARRGGPAVAIGRFVAVVRALIPGVVGMSGMRLRTFTLYTVIGGVLWSALWVSVGYVAGASYSRILHDLGVWAFVVVAVLVVAGVAWFVHRQRRDRAERRALAAGGDTGAPGGDD